MSFMSIAKLLVVKTQAEARRQTVLDRAIRTFPPPAPER